MNNEIKVGDAINWNVNGIRRNGTVSRVTSKKVWIVESNPMAVTNSPDSWGTFLWKCNLDDDDVTVASR